MRHAGAEMLAVLGASCRSIQVGCYDLAMPDITYAGGHERFRRLAALAQTVGFEIVPHNPADPIFCRWRCNSAKGSVSSA